MLSMGSIDIMRQLRESGLADAELAARAGLARETVARWRSGVQKPSLDALEELATAAGAQLDVRVVQADPEHIALVHDQLDLDPVERLRALLGVRAWRSCRDALHGAAALGEIGVLVGPVAAALLGAPQRLGNGRVDVLVQPEDSEDVFERLWAVDGHPDGVAAASGDIERRERWIVGAGLLTVRSAASGVSIAGVRDRAHNVGVFRDDIGVVRLPLVEDLLDVAVASPWSDDRQYVPGLRAVLASGRYSTREVRARTAS
jgi:transcriptional regulator with XRE-family HTH domain